MTHLHRKGEMLGLVAPHTSCRAPKQIMSWSSSELEVRLHRNVG